MSNRSNHSTSKANVLQREDRHAKALASSAARTVIVDTSSRIGWFAASKTLCTYCTDKSSPVSEPSDEPQAVVSTHLKDHLTRLMLTTNVLRKDSILLQVRDGILSGCSFAWSPWAQSACIMFHHAIFLWHLRAQSFQSYPCPGCKWV